MNLLDSCPAPVRHDPRPLPAEVIIPEARKREGRRRLLIALVIMLVLGLGLGLGISFGGGDGTGNGQRLVPEDGGAGPARGSTPPHSALANEGVAPAGWAPVPLTGVQVSVPAFWEVEPRGQAVCGQFKGAVLLGMGLHLRPLGCTQPFHVDNVVALHAGGAPAPPNGKQVFIHGLRVTLASNYRTGTEMAWVTGMIIAARGPLASTIIRTITHSPRSVVLGPYRASVPRAWRHVNFGGLSFSVPKRWATQRGSWIGGCPVNISPSTLVLSTAYSLSAPSCSPPPNTVGYMAERAGMLVFAGPKVSATRAQLHGATCPSHNGLRVCVRPYQFEGGYSATNYPGLLTTEVYLPGRTRPDLVEIGLSGTGLTPLRIFDSLRPTH